MVFLLNNLFDSDNLIPNFQLIILVGFGLNLNLDLIDFLIKNNKNVNIFFFNYAYDVLKRN